MRVLGALAARQIDQDQPSSQLVVPLPDDYLANGVGAGTGIVGNCGMRGSIGVCLLHNSQQIFGGFCVFFSEAWNLYISIFVLEDVEHAFLVEQIKAPPSVNLEVADGDSETFFRQFEQLIYD